MKTNNREKITKIAVTGVLSAIAAVLMILDFPVWFAPAFYKIDFSDLPALLGAFLCGPAAGCIIVLIKTLLNLFLNGTVTMYIGELSSLIMSLMLVLPAGLIFKKHNSIRGCVIALATGVVAVTFGSTAINLFLLIPAYCKAFGIDLDAILGMANAVNPAVKSAGGFLMLCVAPFNLMKSGICALLTFLTHKKLGGLLDRMITR